MATNTPPVQSVETAFRVLDALVELDGATVTAVAEHLDVPTSTANDHLRTLAGTRHLVVKEDGTYRVGPGMIGYAGDARMQLDLFRIGRREVDELARKTGEHANLAMFDSGTGRVIYQAIGENSIRQASPVGRELPLHATSLGKAILSELPDAEVESILRDRGLDAITDRTRTDVDDLLAELAEIRERGYATDNGEYLQGMHCIGAPITDLEGSVEGAVSVSGPIKRTTGDRFDEDLPDAVLETANVVEVNLNQRV